MIFVIKNFLFKLSLYLLILPVAFKAKFFPSLVKYSHQLAAILIIVVKAYFPQGGIVDAVIIDIHNDLIEYLQLNLLFPFIFVVIILSVGNIALQA